MTHQKTHQTGFSLIELMIVVAILAIVAALAYPSYKDQIRKTRRSEATQMLMEVAAQQERFFTNNNRYAADMTELGYGNANQLTEKGFYSVSTSATNAPIGFSATAVPQNDQANDAYCDEFSIDNVGNKDAGDSSADAIRNCW